MFTISLYHFAAFLLIATWVTSQGHSGTASHLSNFFTCESDGRRIPAAWTCDDDEDCNDGSDERGCDGNGELNGFVDKDGDELDIALNNTGTKIVEDQLNLANQPQNISTLKPSCQEGFKFSDASDSCEVRSTNIPQKQRNRKLLFRTSTSVIHSQIALKAALTFQDPTSVPALKVTSC
jgi:hypothetical protein